LDLSRFASGGLELPRVSAILICSALAGGCASVFEGTSQDISVTTTPPGAHCMLLRNGEMIATVNSTPGRATIQKTRDDLVIVCSKRGYSAATFVNRSGLAMVAYANILTAGLSWAVDTSRGADNKYQGQVDLALVPLGSGPAEPRVPVVPDYPPPPPVPGGVPRGTTPVQAPSPAAPAPVEQQLNCTASDGSRIRVTGTACPAGWTPAR
jgi:hypothetical protein